MKRHVRNSFFVVGEGVLEFDNTGEATTRQPSTTEELRRFRFSRLGPKGERTDEEVRIAIAEAMTDQDLAQPDSADPAIPAGFTYLGQFVDHDLTMDRSEGQLGQDVDLDELLQGRSPALDLDSVYGRGPRDKDDQVFYAEDGVKLKVGTTTPVDFPDQGTNVPFEGFDLPRRGGTAGTPADRRAPLIPDPRNDENLVIAQTHLAFIRFHNRVVDELSLTGLTGERLFRAAKELVVRHYQFMLRTDFLPRIVDPAIVDDVFTNGRRFFEVPGKHYGHGNTPTMPIEFSVASYRLGHSMIRGALPVEPRVQLDRARPDRVAGAAVRVHRHGGQLRPGSRRAGGPRRRELRRRPSRCPATGSRTSAASTTSPRRTGTTSRRPRTPVAATSPSGSTRDGRPAAQPAGRHVRRPRHAVPADRAQPRVPQPDQGQHDGTGQRSADRRALRGRAAHRRADPGGQRWRRPRAR